MAIHEQAEPMSHVDRLVATVVVHKDAGVDEFGHFRYRRLECSGGVICRHDDRNAFAIDHRVGSLRLVYPRRRAVLSLGRSLGFALGSLC